MGMPQILECSKSKCGQVFVISRMSPRTSIEQPHFCCLCGAPALWRQFTTTEYALESFAARLNVSPKVAADLFEIWEQEAAHIPFWDWVEDFLKE